MTCRPVKVRILEHMSTIRCKKSNTRLTNHFLITKHLATDLHWVILEQVGSCNNTTEHALFEKEQRWVHRLSTYANGLNDNIPFGAFYN